MHGEGSTLGGGTCLLSGAAKRKDYHPPPLPPYKPVQAPQPTHAVTPGNILGLTEPQFPHLSDRDKTLPLEAMKKSPQSLWASQIRDEHPAAFGSQSVGVEDASRPLTRRSISTFTSLGSGEDGGGVGGSPWEDPAGAERRGLPIPRGATGGQRGPGGGAGENPPGRHPEWLISADESLFSFRLNTLNRAPSDVYLHSLRANAGGGPRRRWRRGHTRAGGCREAGASAAGSGERRRFFPAPALESGGGSGRPGSAFLCPGTRWTGQPGDPGGLYSYGPLSPSSMPALEAAIFCTMWYNIILL